MPSGTSTSALNEVEKAMVVKLAEHTGLSLSDVMRSALRAQYRTTFGHAATFTETRR